MGNGSAAARLRTTGRLGAGGEARRVTAAAWPCRVDGAAADFLRGAVARFLIFVTTMNPDHHKTVVSAGVHPDHAADCHMAGVRYFYHHATESCV